MLALRTRLQYIFFRKTETQTGMVVRLAVWSSNLCIMLCIVRFSLM